MSHTFNIYYAIIITNEYSNEEEEYLSRLTEQEEHILLNYVKLCLNVLGEPITFEFVPEANTIIFREPRTEVSLANDVFAYLDDNVACGTLRPLWFRNYDLPTGTQAVVRFFHDKPMMFDLDIQDYIRYMHSTRR